MTDALPEALHSALEVATQLGSQREAVRFAGTSLTYGELNHRSNQLAHLLVSRGVQKGDRVGIYAPKGLESAVAIYGILKAGAAYVPLDPTAPPARAALIARDCGIEHLVTHPSLASALRDITWDSIRLKTAIGIPAGEAESGVSVTWAQVASVTPAEAQCAVGDDDLAYILYTSGSTGTPKGVAHSHRSAVAFARMAAAAYGLKSSDRITNHAPLHFDLSTLDYFAAAVAGATTVIIPESYTKLPASLSKLLEVEAVTVLYAVPLAVAQLLHFGALEKRDLSALRWILFGGEPFPPKHLRALMTLLPQTAFANVYGPTEVNGVTTWLVPPLPENSMEPIPIGRPYPGVDLVVVGADGQSVPAGEAGELWVRSPTMMRGYWGRPDLDEHAFAVLPNDSANAVYHRTGDLVRMDESDVLHFLGRMDRQIKTRGYRVELDEVEAVLEAHNGVESAAAFAVDDGQGSRAIEAAVVLIAPSSLTVPDLLRYAATVLPPYAVPMHLEVLRALPETSTGKIDRVTLTTTANARRRLQGQQVSA